MLQEIRKPAFSPRCFSCGRWFRRHLPPSSSP